MIQVHRIRPCIPLPKVSNVNFTRFSQASGLETSVGQTAASVAPFSRHSFCTSSNFSFRRAANTTLAPLFEYSRAIHCSTWVNTIHTQNQSNSNIYLVRQPSDTRSMPYLSDARRSASDDNNFVFHDTRQAQRATTKEVIKLRDEHSEWKEEQ